MLQAINWNEVLPVIISILVIILIAVFRHYSDTLTAIASVMPIKVPLAMWIFLSARDKTQADFSGFNAEMLINILPTVAFLVAAYVISRNGYGLVPTILGGYAVWGIALGTVFGAKTVLGVA